MELSFNEVFKELESSLNYINFYDISSALCDKNSNRCITFNKEKEPLYFDDDHLSSIGSKYIVDEIVDWLVSKKLDGF